MVVVEAGKWVREGGEIRSGVQWWRIGGSTEHTLLQAQGSLARVDSELCRRLLLHTLRQAGKRDLQNAE